MKPSLSGSDCREQFKAAYENRYTWETTFSGYKGNCSWSNGQSTQTGSFFLDKELKATVKGINDKKFLILPFPK